MLKTRVITAIVMLLIAMAVVFGTPNLIFAVLAGTAILGVGGWEAARLARIQSPIKQWLFAGALLLASLGLWQWLSSSQHLYWLIVAAITWTFPIFSLKSPTQRHPAPLVVLVLIVILTGAWLSLVILQAKSPWWIVLAVVLVAAADIGAYFSGRAIGGLKLAPSISPGKTWAGAIGGVVFATLLTPLALIWLPIETSLTGWQAGLLGLILAPISILGDLFVSVLKRQAGLKDSSKLLPGHGGLLDRLDSLSAVLPFFTLLIGWTHAA